MSMIRRPTYRSGTVLLAGALLATGLAAAHSPAVATKPGSGSSTGSARIFMVNPVQSTGDQGLLDAKDSAGSVPAEAYAVEQLRNLDGSGYLRGKWVAVESATGTPAFSRTNTFLYNR